MHVKTIALAKGKQLRQIIFVRCMLERDYQTPASFASDARDTRNAFESLNEGSLINRVIEPHAGIHLVETQYRVGHGAMIETRIADVQAQRRPGSRTGIVRVSVPADGELVRTMAYEIVRQLASQSFSETRTPENSSS